MEKQKSKRPNKRRHVTSEEFSEALYGRKGDPESMQRARDNQYVLNSVIKRYSGLVPYDELGMCRMHALWRCLSYHDSNHPRKQKFTTSLYRFIKWECNRELAKIVKRSEREQIDSYHLPAYRHKVIDTERKYLASDETRLNIELMHECLAKLPHEWQGKILRQKYIDGMSTSEICKVHGFSKETARLRIRQATQALKRIVQARSSAF